MSGFSDGVISGLAGGGLANSISKLMMLGPQIEQMRQKGVLNGAQAALYQAKRDSELSKLQRYRMASAANIRDLGDWAANLDTTNASNLRDAVMLGELRKQNELINKAFPMETNRDLVERMTSAEKPSFSEDAQVTPPISAFRGSRPQPTHEDNMALVQGATQAVLNLDNLKKRQNLLARGVAMTKGNDMYKSIGNTGYSIDPYLGDSKVSNEELVRMYTDKANLDIANKQSIITNRGQIMARRAATPIRGSGGGHHKRRGGGRGGVKTQVVTVDGRKLLIDKQTGETIKDLGSADSRGRGGRRGGGGSSGMTVQQAMAFAGAHPELFGDED